MKTEVAETRVIDENPRWTKRRRLCKNCGYTFWTVEMPAEDVVLEEDRHWAKLTKEERYDCVNYHIGLSRSDDPQLHDAVYSIVDEVEKKLKEKNGG